jgi:preprotein translocase SecE subunit
MDHQKIVNLALIIAAVAVGAFLTKLFETIWVLAHLPRFTEWFVSPALAISIFVSVVGFVVTRRHERANKYFNEVVMELSKVTWPEQKETIQATGVSCILIAICAGIFFLFDSLWGTVLNGAFAL